MFQETDSRGDESAEDLARCINDITDEISFVFIGRKRVVRLALTAVLAGGHILHQGINFIFNLDFLPEQFLAEESC